MAIFSTLASRRAFHPCLATSTFASASIQITIRPIAYSYRVPGSASPAASSLFGYSMSAEKNRSKGAPFCICGNFFSQKQKGAPFYMFFSADLEYPKRLDAERLAEPGNRKDNT